MLKILTLLTLTRKIKQCKVALLWIKLFASRSASRSRSLDFNQENGPEYEPRSGKNCQITERYYESNWRFTLCANISKNKVSHPNNSRSKSFSSSTLCWRKIICEFSETRFHHKRFEHDLLLVLQRSYQYQPNKLRPSLSDNRRECLFGNGFARKKGSIIFPRRNFNGFARIKGIRSIFSRGNFNICDLIFEADQEITFTVEK